MPYESGGILFVSFATGECETVSALFRSPHLKLVRVANGVAKIMILVPYRTNLVKKSRNTVNLLIIVNKSVLLMILFLELSRLRSILLPYFFVFLQIVCFCGCYFYFCVCNGRMRCRVYEATIQHACALFLGKPV